MKKGEGLWAKSWEVEEIQEARGEFLSQLLVLFYLARFNIGLDLQGQVFPYPGEGLERISSGQRSDS